MESQSHSKVGDFSPSNRVFVLGAIAFVIGIVASYVALVLLKLISFFTNLFFFGRISLESVSPAANHLGAWVILIPAVGGLIIGLMARYGSERIRGHGIPEALEAILFGKSVMRPKVALLKPLSSAISIGSGGPFGAEGPIIMTGGAVGSLIAQLFHLTSGERKTLLVSGASAGMAAIFASPIAAILLAVELLLFEWRPRSLIPVAIASVTAAVMRTFLLGTGPVFPFAVQAPLSIPGLLACCLVGLVAGVFSASLSGLLYKIEDLFQRLPIHWMWWCALGGLVVGLGGYFQPRALGVGYDVIEDLLKGNVLLQAAMALLAVKSIIWVVSLASGTSGGVLAPLLMMGCGLGVIEAKFFPEVYRALYPMISMAAVMGGMMRAPFTAVMFTLELTHNLDSLLPALTATIFSYGVTVLIMKRSILTEKIARRGFHIFREYVVDPLELTRVSEIMSCDVISVPAELPLEQVMSRFFDGKSKHRGYPVIDAQGRLHCMITATDILKFRLGEFPKDRRACEIGRDRTITIRAEQSCREAAEKMALHSVGRLPVVVSEKDGDRVIGIVTRSDLLKPRLSHHEAEEKRERLFKNA